jgi:hypothetical protein
VLSRDASLSLSLLLCLLNRGIAVVELVNKLEYRELKNQLLPRICRIVRGPASPANPLSLRVAGLMCLAKIASVFDSDTLLGGALPGGAAAAAAAAATGGAAAASSDAKDAGDGKGNAAQSAPTAHQLLSGSVIEAVEAAVSAEPGQPAILMCVLGVYDAFAKLTANVDLVATRVLPRIAPLMVDKAVRMHTLFVCLWSKSICGSVLPLW